MSPYQSFSILSILIGFLFTFTSDAFSQIPGKDLYLKEMKKLKLDTLNISFKEEKLPGMAEHLETENPGMHTTDTVDYEVVISGEVVLELDDGAEVTLKPGDTVIQNGTRHAWRNRTEKPAVLVVVLIGAKRSS